MITTSWHGASVDHARRQRVGDGLDPGRRRSRRAACRSRCGRHRGSPPGPATSTAMSKRRPLESVGCVNRNALRSGSGDAAAILPAHQRVHLGVFVDRLVDHDEQALARQRQHVLVQVGIAAWMPAAARRGSVRARSMRRPQLDRPSAPPPNTHFSARYRNKALIAAAAANASASPLTNPVTCNPSGSPSSCNTGSESAGMPSSESVHGAVGIARRFEAHGRGGGRGRGSRRRRTPPRARHRARAPCRVARDRCGSRRGVMASASASRAEHDAAELARVARRDRC